MRKRTALSISYHLYELSSIYFENIQSFFFKSNNWTSYMVKVSHRPLTVFCWQILFHVFKVAKSFFDEVKLDALPHTKSTTKLKRMSSWEIVRFDPHYEQILPLPLSQFIFTGVFNWRKIHVSVSQWISFYHISSFLFFYFVRYVDR